MNKKAKGSNFSRKVDIGVNLNTTKPQKLKQYYIVKHDATRVKLLR